MLGNIKLCNTVKLPVIQREALVGNDKIFNSRALKTWKSDVLGSKNISTDVTGVMFAKEGHFAAFNAQPVAKPNGYKYILDKLDKFWQSAVNSGNLAWGFLCGGLSQDSDRNLSPFSYELYNRIADFFDEKQLPFAMICGKKDVDTEDGLRIYKNKVFMYSDNIENCFKDSRSIKETIDKVPDYYSDVFIPEDIEFSPFYTAE